MAGVFQITTGSGVGWDAAAAVHNHVLAGLSQGTGCVLLCLPQRRTQTRCYGLQSGSQKLLLRPFQILVKKNTPSTSGVIAGLAHRPFHGCQLPPPAVPLAGSRRLLHVLTCSLHAGILTEEQWEASWQDKEVRGSATCRPDGTVAASQVARVLGAATDPLRPPPFAAGAAPAGSAGGHSQAWARRLPRQASAAHPARMLCPAAQRE